MGVISLRLKDKVLKRIGELSRLESKDKSTIARELLEYGWEFLMVKYYKDGKLSLEGLAKKLAMLILSLKKSINHHALLLGEYFCLTNTPNCDSTESIELLLYTNLTEYVCRNVDIGTISRAT